MMMNICRFCEDIELMTGTRPGLYLCICWKYISPAVMISILVAFFVKLIFGTMEYEAWVQETASTVKLEWPSWTLIVIFVLITMSIGWIPFIALTVACGWRLLTKEKPAWFPTQELREDTGLTGDREITNLERKLLGWKEGGVEGVCCPTATYTDQQPEDEVFI
jgi:solute carrier family 6 amino acid/orphan transporter-like 15/16/17/18/20